MLVQGQAYARTHARSSIQSAFVRDPCNSKKRTVVGKSDGFFDGLRWAVNRGGGGRGREADGNVRITPVEHIHESSLTSTSLQANDQTEPRRSPRLRTKVRPSPLLALHLPTLIFPRYSKTNDRRTIDVLAFRIQISNLFKSVCYHS